MTRVARNHTLSIAPESSPLRGMTWLTKRQAPPKQGCPDDSKTQGGERPQHPAARTHQRARASDPDRRAPRYGAAVSELERGPEAGPVDQQRDADPACPSRQLSGSDQRAAA